MSASSSASGASDSEKYFGYDLDLDSDDSRRSTSFDSYSWVPIAIEVCVNILSRTLKT